MQRQLLTAVSLASLMAIAAATGSSPERRENTGTHDSSTHAAATAALTGNLPDTSCHPRESVFDHPADSVAFVLSANYPTALPTPAPGDRPWMQFDPTSSVNWHSYLYAVLKYVYEGNVTNGFDVQKNMIRQWYHAPWMHLKLSSSDKARKDGYGGREWLHGLTQEREAPIKDLYDASNKRDSTKNWAVGFYNEAGGFAIRNAWEKICDGSLADTVRFPVGTVAFKLLFTSAHDSDVPYLKASPVWLASITRNDVSQRTPLRLIQIDIMVRDTRADQGTGWVFGSFLMDGRRGIAPELREMASGADTGWFCVYPIGIAWGNDPARAAKGMEANAEQFIDPDVQKSFRGTMGWHGRLNGPVDNPNASCIGCHSQAQRPLNDAIPIPSPSKKFDRKNIDDLQSFFTQNLKPGQALTPGWIGLDYSLQLQSGIASYWNARRIVLSAHALRTRITHADSLRLRQSFDPVTP
ncbi:MAG: hypothetical protein JST22_01570 [Bacteroidetes bacterium]|nr:hypothetical protein [Bacteroidota bacterium]